jgi:hypothetical protein
MIISYFFYAVARRYGVFPPLRFGSFFILGSPAGSLWCLTP